MVEFDFNMCDKVNAAVNFADTSDETTNTEVPAKTVDTENKEDKVAKIAEMIKDLSDEDKAKLLNASEDCFSGIDFGTEYDPATREEIYKGAAKSGAKKGAAIGALANGALGALNGAVTYGTKGAIAGALGGATGGALYGAGIGAGVNALRARSRMNAGTDRDTINKQLGIKTKNASEVPQESEFSYINYLNNYSEHEDDSESV